MALNDYQCSKCERIVESYSPPSSVCECGGVFRTVFTTAPQIRTQHASVVNHVMDMNKQMMKEVYAEDSRVDSEAALINRQGQRIL